MGKESPKVPNSVNDKSYLQLAFSWHLNVSKNCKKKPQRNGN